ncbi:hypothetical protein CKAH01_13670 [Colletotrichum kahawae]|uniref:Uncharacterized protein n=1 Tax=Colletotrichum kahawae TaxID=34407 RepID=A0AAE0DB80_COLKA|nr:hypothetical protein CKAH01_13670 [Colletotrichum kahawae]
MPTDRDHLMYLGDHLGIDKGNCSGLLTFTANYLLSLRLITLAFEDLIYYKPTTYDLSVLLLRVNPQLLLADPTVG